MWWLIPVGLFALGFVALVVHDLVQRSHAVMRNFPVVGHLRYWLERIGPELRQYIVTDNDQERPFSRDQRRWIYTSSKGINTYWGFGTDKDIERPENYLVLKPAVFPLPAPPGSTEPDHQWPLPCAKVLGAARGRAHAFRPASVVNISAMSFGSMSAAAIESLNRGAALAGVLHNTGEGGISPYHLRGGELVWQLGTGTFGCRDEQGRFSLERLVAQVEQHPVRAIEIKLSQGAKPGLGGVLPGRKVTPEIAEIRGVPVGVTCASPPTHATFHDVDSMLDFVEQIAQATGLPVGIKSAVGEQAFWADLAERMAAGDRGVDFITIDGGEGGTGAAPLVYSDHVSLPFKWGFSRVYREFAQRGIADDVVFVGSGKLGLPENGLLAMALGCDLVNVAREVMLSIGCIQAQRCHTGACPAGVTTQSAWLQHGLDPDLKSVRCARYLVALRMELGRVARTCGVVHPALLRTDQIEVLHTDYGARTVQDVFAYEPGWGLPAAADQVAVAALMAPEPV